MMLKKILPLVSLTFLFHFAYAAHPLITDDPNTQGLDAYQIEMNTDWLRDDGVKSHVGTLTLTKGFSENADIYLNIPMTYSNPSGVNDVGLGVKWKFLHVDGLSMGLKPELRVASGDQQKDLGDGKSGAALLWMTQYEWGDFIWLFNIGSEYHRFSDPVQGSLHHSYVNKASMAMLYAINKEWTVLLDTGKRTNALKSQSSPESIVFGVIYHPGEDLDIDVGYKKALNRAEIDRQIGLGFTWRFK
jgi:hypothetical protein